MSTPIKMKNIRGYFNVYISELYRAIFSLFLADCSALHSLHTAPYLAASRTLS